MFDDTRGYLGHSRDPMALQDLLSLLVCASECSGDTPKANGWRKPQCFPWFFGSGFSSARNPRWNPRNMKTFTICPKHRHSPFFDLVQLPPILTHLHVVYPRRNHPIKHPYKGVGVIKYIIPKRTNDTEHTQFYLPRDRPTLMVKHTHICIHIYMYIYIYLSVHTHIDR